MLKELVNKRYGINISWETMVEERGFCWFTSDYYNGLFRAPTETVVDPASDIVNVEFCGLFPNEKGNKRLWASIESYEKYLIFVPLMADNFTIYNMENGEFISEPICVPQNIDFPAVQYSPTAKFSFCICQGNKVIYFPYYYPSFAVLDLYSFKVEYVETPLKNMSSYLKGKGPYFWRSTLYKRDDGKIILWSRAFASLVSFQIDNLDMQIEKEIETEDPYLDAVHAGNAWWLIPHLKDEKIARIDTKDYSVTYYQLPSNIRTANCVFTDAQLIGDDIVLLPKVSDRGVVINTKSMEIKFINCLDKYSIDFYNSESWNFRSAYSIESKVLSFSSANIHSFLLDCDDWKVYLKDMKLSVYDDMKEADLKILIRDMEKEWNTYLFEESNLLDVKSFIML